MVHGTRHNNRKEHMKTIKYNGREYKLPFNVQLPEDPTVQVEIKNRLGGESTTLPEFAAAVYDTIIGAEMFGDYNKATNGELVRNLWN
jgi:hypothetical protein